MFTLVGYYDATAHAALAAIAAIADPHVRVSGNDIYVPALNKMLAVFAGGSGLEECRMQSPSLRRLVNQRIEFIYPQAMPPGDWMGLEVHLWKERARTLDIAEALNAFCLNSVAAAAEYVFIWLMDKLEALPAGEIASLEGTVSLTAVVGAWVNGAITFTQTLPAGRYAICGMRIRGGSVVAARCVFPDISPRPGCIGTPHYYEPGIAAFRYGGLGNWGEFEHDAPPSIDVLGATAGALTYDVVMDLIQVRAGRR